MKAVSTTRPKPEKLALIGCGPTARENYLKTFPRVLPPDRRLKLVVDVRSQQEKIKNFFDELGWQPEELLFLDGADHSSINRCAIPKLAELHSKHELDGLFVLTEPKSHVPYIKWGIEHDLSVLTEKPITASPDASIRPEAAREIWTVFERLASLLRRHPEAAVSVMTQRRCHRIYDFIRDTVKDAVLQHGIPVTKIDISYSDGMWNMPEELGKENHPYKYGYGMLHHGGYHFVDLLSELVENNYRVPQKRPDNVTCFSNGIFPSDNAAQLSEADLDHLLAISKPDAHPNAHYGELDLHSSIAWKRQDRIICHASLNLQHTGITRRAWREARPDGYKGNGRIKQERLHVQVGPILDIFLNSSEIIEPSDLRFSEWVKNGTLGGSNHYEVTVLRNAALIGGPEMERRHFRDFYPEGLEVSAMRKARDEVITRFLNGENPAPLANQALTNFHMAVIAESLTIPFRGQRPVTKRILP